MRIRQAVVSLVLGLGMASGFLWFLGGGSLVTHADSEGGILRVAPTGADAPGCGSAISPCGTVQFAVHQATPGDEIRLATGVYTGVQNAPSLNTERFTATQVVVITKSLTLRGGYTVTNWDAPDAEANPTTLDAQGEGRVVVIIGPITATLEGLKITNGHAHGLGSERFRSIDGGGVYVRGANVTLSGLTVYSNAASRLERLDSCYGGGIYIDDSDTPKLLDNLVMANMASLRHRGYGGGIYLRRSPSALLRGNVISGNVGAGASNGAGGGLQVYVSDGLILDDNIFRNNTGSGGADYRGGGVHMSNCDGAMLTRNVFEGNLASEWWGWGGGLYLARSDDAALIGNRLEANVASELGQGWGGALYADSCLDLTLSRNLVTRNVGTQNLARSSWGAGLCLALGGPVTLTNNVVADNTATTSGSGLVIQGASSSLLHNTFARNGGGDGSAMLITSFEDHPSAVTLTNTLMVSHSVGISVTGGNTLTLNATLWHSAPITVSRSPTAALMAQLQLAGDPAFGPDGYHLTAASAALNRAVATAVTTDIDGQRRPAAGRADIGADELVPVFLPLIMRN